MNILELKRLFPGRWVVLGPGLAVIDHGEDLAALRARHAARRCTFFFVA